MPKIDLTNGVQKGIAAVALLAGIYGFYLLLPLIGIAVVLVFLILARGTIWDGLKQLTFKLTKKMIYGNAPYYLYKYHDFLVQKYTDLNRSINQLVKIYKQQNAMAVKLQDEIKRAVSRASSGHAASGIEAKLKDKTLKGMIPQLEYLRKRIDKMTEVYSLRVAEAEEAKVTIDAKVQEYEIFKELNKGVSAANASMDKNSPEFKEYQMAVGALEDQMFSYAANIEDFDRRMKPEFEKSAADQKALEAESIDFLKEYKEAIVVPKFKELAQPVA